MVNESGLTGESMPVQKLALPNEAGREYDSHGSGARSTLFACTHTHTHQLTHSYTYTHMLTETD